MNTDIQTFRRALLQELTRHDIEMSARHRALFCKHYELLRKWYPRVRLTGTIDPARVAIELFADSIITARFIGSFGIGGSNDNPLRMIDIGSGAGFPSIPVTVMNPIWTATLVDSNTKKVSFIKNLARELRLSNVTAVRGRAEKLAHMDEHRERYDLALCRAVGTPSLVCELAMPLLKKGGVFIGQICGHRTEDERISGEEEFQTVGGLYGGTVRERFSYELSNVPVPRLLMRVEKVLATPRNMPRISAQLGKRPFPR